MSCKVLADITFLLLPFLFPGPAFCLTFPQQHCSSFRKPIYVALQGYYIFSLSGKSIDELIRLSSQSVLACQCVGASVGM